MGKPSDHPDFKALKKKWDQILEETSFKDAEDSAGRLKQSSSGIYPRYGCHTKDQRRAREQYYARLGQCVHRTSFPQKIEKFIMEMFANGANQAEIGERLDYLGMSMHRVTINRVVQKWLREWNLRD